METSPRPLLFSKWDYLFLLGLIGLTGFYFCLLPRLPDPVPTHFNALGQPDGWTAKAKLPYLIFLFPLCFWGVPFVVGNITAKISQKASPQMEALQPMRGVMGLGACLLMGACLSTGVYGIKALWPGLVVFFFSVLLGVKFMTSRLKRLPQSGSTSTQHYRWGCFYNNPDDPRLWVEKRMGYGWTLNYAKPSAWLITVLLISLPILVVILTKR